MRCSFDCLVRTAGLIWLILGLHGQAAATNLVLTVDPADTPLVITGLLDGQTTTFHGNVRLTVTGGDVNELQFLPSDLQHASDVSVIIDRSNITIPSGTSLSDGQPRDVPVTVNNVVRPGDYAGEMKFLLPGQTEVQALVIPLELHIGARPKVQPVKDNLTIQVVRCQYLLSCAMTAWLLPDSMTREDWIVQLDNQTLTPVKLAGATVVMQGDRASNAVRADAIDVELPPLLPANQVESVGLVIHSRSLPPDHYQGVLRFKLADADEPVLVNVNLDVRDGPFWALVAIVAGIIVGRLARSMESPKTQKQLKLLPRFYEARDNAHRVQDAEALAYLNRLFSGIRNRIESAQEDEVILFQAIDQANARTDFLAHLEELERQLPAALKAELRPILRAARRAIIGEDVAQAEQLCREVEAHLRKAQDDDTMGATTDLFGSLLGIIHVIRTQLTETGITSSGQRPGDKRWAWLAWLMAMLSGGRVIGAETRFWLVRPLLFLLLLGGLALLGLQTLYVNAGASFGSAGLFDYLGLFLWGISADVAQRTLQDLQLIRVR